MLTTLFSVTFTSCIDNEVSPIVEAIYEAQADLIAAQAGVQNAEAAYLLAQAEAEQAQAAWTTAQAAQVDAYTAGIVETNSYNALRNEQAILLLVAQTNRDVAAAENAMELAQVTFEAAMQTAIAAMEAAGATIATGYATQYFTAMSEANNLMSQLLTAQGNLADAQLMLTGTVGSEISFAYHLAQLQNAVSLKQSEIAAGEAYIAIIEATATDPIAAKKIIDEKRIELRAQYEDLLQQEQAQQNVIAALNFEVGDRNASVSQLASALADHNSAVGQRNTRLASIEIKEGQIDAYEIALVNADALYDAAVAALGTAYTAPVAGATAKTGTDAYSKEWNANLAVLNAVKARGVTNGTPIISSPKLTGVAIADLYDVLWNAQIDVLVLDAKVAALYGSYQTAIATLATAEGIYATSATTLASNLSTAEGAKVLADAALVAAQIDYTAKYNAFIANPNAFTWLAGADGALGLHADASTVTNSYRIVNATDNGVETGVSSTTGVGAPISHGTYATYTLFLAAATAGTLAPGDYYNIGADDVALGTNAQRLDAAVVVLGNNYQFAPEAGDTAKGLSDAYSVAWDAALAVLNAGVAIASNEQTILDARAAFALIKDLYENQADLLDAADLAVTTATGNITTANTALGTDNGTPTVLSTKKTGTLDLYDVYFNAQIDRLKAAATLATLQDADTIQAAIDALNLQITDLNEEIASIQAFIDAKYAVVAGLLGVLTADGVEWTFEVDEDGKGYFEVTNDTVLGASYSDLRAELIAENQVLWTIQRDMAAVSSEITLNENLRSQWNASYEYFVKIQIPSLKASLVLLETGLEQALAKLALATNDETAAEAHIAYLEALIDTLEAKHATTLAIAAKYKALMEAALAS